MVRPHECYEDQDGLELIQTISNSDALTAETPDSKEILGPEWNGDEARERVFAKLRLLWARRRFVARCAVGGLVLTTVAAFAVPKEYVSTARLMPPDSQSSNGLVMMAALAGQGGGGLGSIASDLLGVKTTGALFVAVLRSRTVEDRIVQRFDLRKVYWTKLQETARTRLEERTGISEDRKSGVITLSATDHDAKRAAAIAGAYIEELDALMAQLNTSSAHRERVFLEERLNTISGDLKSAEKDFSQFASKNAAIDIPAQGKAMLEGAATLQGQLIGAESQLEGLRQIYSDNNVRVRSTEARIAELRTQLQKLGGKYSGDNSGSAESSPDNSYPTLRQLPILGVSYADKFRQLKVEEAVYETLTRQFELAKVEEAKEIPSVKVLDPPDVPERKSFPPRLMIIAMGTMCAVLLSVVWVFGTARWQAIDPQNPGKIFAQEVAETVRARIPWVTVNGSGRNGQPGEHGGETDVRSKAASAGS
jgi:uncharacterized protein involved in exopolysaccharide biosynthesis